MANLLKLQIEDIKFIFRINCLILMLITQSVSASVSNGPYLGLEIGASNQIINFNSELFNSNMSGINLTNSSLGFASRLNLGYSIDRYNSFELGTSYNFGFSHQYPDKQGILNSALWSEDLSYILSIPTSIDKLSVFGRIGGSYDWSSSNCCCKQSISINDFTDTLGAGLGYKLSVRSIIRIEWISNGLFFPVEVNNGSSNIGLLTSNNFELGINYYF